MACAAKALMPLFISLERELLFGVKFVSVPCYKFFFFFFTIGIPIHKQYILMFNVLLPEVKKYF